MWNGKIWWASSQDISLIYINFQELDSVLTTWGTDGNSFFPLFQQPSTGFVKIAQTKLWDKPGGYQFTKFVTRLWAIFKLYDPRSPTVTVSIDNETASDSNLISIVPPGGGTTWVTAAGADSTWLTAGNILSVWLASGVNYSVVSAQAVAQSGVLTGFTMTTSSADMALVSAMIHDEVGGYRG